MDQRMLEEFVDVFCFKNDGNKIPLGSKTRLEEDNCIIYQLNNIFIFGQLWFVLQKHEDQILEGGLGHIGLL